MKNRKKAILLALLLAFAAVFTGCGESITEESIYQASKDRAETLSEDDYTTYKYSTLARHPNDCEGKQIKIRGEVFQVLEQNGEDLTHVLFSVGGDDDNIVYGYIHNDNMKTRPMEGDDIRCYGISTGIYTYETVDERNLSVPSMFIDKITVLNEE